MAPPPPSNLAARIFLGPALRSQPDRRLVSLMRDGYEGAFEEIVRRYDKPLQRYAAAIVPMHRADDVTQDAFSKALLALRGTDKEIELRPWLYRIVRNTALNDIRDQPPASQPIPESIDGTETPEQAAERRAEIADLLERLRALPETQRAAIVMRELEGLSHEEIAASLGITGGAARQTIFRARRALRDGFGLIVPLPVLHALLGGMGGAATTAGAAGAGAGTGALASAGGAGASAGLKGGLATLLVAGSVATGVALHERSDVGSGEDSARAAETRQATQHGHAGSDDAAAQRLQSETKDHGGSSDSGPGENSGPGGDGDDDRGGDEGPEHASHSGPGAGGDDGGADNSGPGGGDTETTSTSSGPGGGDGGADNSGPGGGGGDDDPLVDNSGPGSLSSGSSGSESSGSGSSGSGSSGSDDRLELPDD
jgi:RNA polymerase sigma factor (sigma-70 family)